MLRDLWQQVQLLNQSYQGVAPITTSDSLPAQNQGWVSMVLVKPGLKHRGPDPWSPANPDFSEKPD